MEVDNWAHCDLLLSSLKLELVVFFGYIFVFWSERLREGLKETWRPVCRVEEFVLKSLKHLETLHLFSFPDEEYFPT